MIAIVERGNSRTKLCLISLTGIIIDVKYWSQFILSSILDEIPNSVKHIRYCNTSKGLESVPTNWMEINADSKWPFELNYSLEVGVDRLALVLGAKLISDALPVLVVSCGTCLTFSYLDSKNIFQGGAISPGLSMRLIAMNSFTGSLPLLTPKYEQDISQKTFDTKSSMQKGAYEGMIYEIEQRISSFQRLDKKLKCFLTGGDGPAFAESLESGIFATPNLEAIGLYAQWKYEQNQ